MADNKKGFILYCDLIHTVEQLPNDKAGELFKHILRYVNDLNPITDDLLTKVTFEPIKQQLKRDLNKWNEKSIKRSEAGRLGGFKSGEVRKQKEANEANASEMKQNEQVTDTVTDTVTVKVKCKVKEEEETNTCFSFDDFWKMYGKSADKIKCQKLYDKITEKEREDIKVKLPIYLSTIKDKKFQKNPHTYLYGKCWNDIDDVSEMQNEDESQETLKELYPNCFWQINSKKIYYKPDWAK